jgi:DNA anti-recombination protein RmuC
LDNPQAKEISSEIQGKKKELQEIEEYLEKLNKCLKKSVKKLQKKETKFNNLVHTTIQPWSDISVPKPEFGTPLANFGD